ncbi:MAG TPA: helix-turn-helix transcriptional regulator [Chloroflexota bacterium]|nr:helix-turn-helix transcriptional regulator [Chloroflexota bacterium]
MALALIRLRTARTMRGLSIAALAKKASVAQRTVWMLESGQIPEPRAKTIYKIATALGRDPREISEFHGTLGLRAD